MADLRIEEYNVGDIGTNCYFIVNADTKEMVIIDPGGDGADLIRRIKERGLKLQAVLLTHGHYDHAHHARMVADAFGVNCILLDSVDRIMRYFLNRNWIKFYSKNDASNGCANGKYDSIVDDHLYVHSMSSLLRR